MVLFQSLRHVTLDDNFKLIKAASGDCFCFCDQCEQQTACTSVSFFYNIDARKIDIFETLDTANGVRV